MVGYMIVRPYVLCAAFIFAPLCSHAQSRVDTLLGDFTTLSWRWKIDRTIPDNTRTNAVSWFDDVEVYVSGRSNDPL